MSKPSTNSGFCPTCGRLIKERADGRLYPHVNGYWRDNHGHRRGTPCAGSNKKVER